MSTSSSLREAVADQARLAALASYQLPGHAGDADLDDVVQQLAQLLHAPIAVVDLVSPGRQCYAAERGVGAAGTDVPDELSFCAHVVAAREPLSVGDAAAHPVFARNPHVRSGAVRAYLGVPLVDVDGFVLGAVGVFDSRPRRFSAEEQAVLQTHARLVRALLTARRHAVDHQRHSRLLQAQRDVLEAIASSRPLPRVLEQLALHVEELLDERVLCSLLLLEEDGTTLRDGAGPSLPAAYREAIDGLRAGPGVGSCGTAVHRREVVVVDDIATDELWRDFRDLAAEHGLAACTSLPVLGEDDTVLGTFALYRRQAGPLDLADGAAVASFSDLARVAIERERSRRRLTELATLDGVTGLLNRSAFLSAAGRVLSRPAAPGAVHAVLFCDVDHFKLVNDSLGHAAGDAYLRAVAEALRGALRAEDVVSRFAGDAFTVLVPDTTPEAAQVLAETIGDCFRLPVRVPGHVVHLAASVGLTSTALSATGELDVLLRDADMAMHAAKQAGRARVRVYDTAMQARSAASSELVLALGEALGGAPEHAAGEPGTRARRPLLGEGPGSGQFQLHYQPEVDTRSGRLVALEALLRWTRPGLGPVSPADFIPAAEAGGFIVELGRRVLDEACRQLAGWRAQHPAARELTVWVNVSAHQLGDAAFVRTVTDALAHHGLPGTALGLEITESAVMADADAARAILAALRGAGVRIAVDDFGTGYSSLSTLRTLPVDVVKVDRSFTSRLGCSPSDQRIVDAIISMAHALDLTVVAEGVEEPQQHRTLRALGCDLVQGYLLGRPVEPARVEESLAEAARQASS